MRDKLRLIDCFCGAGGLSLGFKNAGFHPLFAFDNDPACIDTYRKNIGRHAYVADAKQMSRHNIEILTGKKLADVSIVAGGPPCQGFSVQRRGSDEDPRNDLVLDFIRIALDIEPSFIVMENVGGLLSPRGHHIMTILQAQLNEAGYVIHLSKLDAYDFGVPQHRKRVVIVAQKRDRSARPFSFPPSIRPSDKYPETVRDAIADLTISTNLDIPNHISDRLSPINLERIRSLKEGESRDKLPEHLQLACHTKNLNHRHLDVYGRMSWDAPSPTITARFDSFSRGRFGHPTLDRTITLREGARIQTFPDSFVFIGTKVQVAKQIGNAVAPAMAFALAQAIKKCLVSTDN